MRLGACVRRYFHTSVYVRRLGTGGNRGVEAVYIAGRGGDGLHREEGNTQDRRSTNGDHSQSTEVL